jgi:hypothetical protein
VMAALRNAFRSLFAGMTEQQRSEQHERMSLVQGVPALRAAVFEQFSTTMDVLADAIAARAGRESDDFAVRTVAGAVIGASMAVLAALTVDPDADYAALMDDAMAQLENGLSL